MPQHKIAKKDIHKDNLKMDKLKKLIEHLYQASEEKFTGYIKVNYSQGSIGRVEKFEEIMKKNGD